MVWRVEYRSDDGDRTAIELATEPTLEDVIALAPRRHRLIELREKGWANLTAAERAEAQGLLMEIGW